MSLWPQLHRCHLRSSGAGTAQPITRVLEMASPSLAADTLGKQHTATRGGLGLRVPTHSRRASSLSLVGPPAVTSHCRRMHGASPGLPTAAPAPPQPVAGIGGRAC